MPETFAPRRRTQAERTADARRRLIAAAVQCLEKNGYGATTINAIAEEAGLSKGAAMHHFPDKIAIMAAVADQVFDDEVQLYQAAIANRLPGETPLAALIRSAWRHYQRPEAMAVLEIWMATRSDPALNAALAPVFAGVKARGTEQADAIMDASGAPSGIDARGLQTMMLATLRGLAIERALTGDPSTHDAAEHLAVFAERLTAKP